MGQISLSVKKTVHLFRKVGPVFSKIKEYRSEIAIASLILLVAFVGWNSLKFHPGQGVCSDAAIYATGGSHLIREKALYREIWINRQPMVLILDALAILFGGESADSIYLMLKGFALVSCMIFS